MTEQTRCLVMLFETKCVKARVVAGCLLLGGMTAILVTMGAGGCIMGRDHAIHQTIQAGDIEALNRELARHPDSVNEPGKFGVTPLMMAAGKHDVEAVRVLLQHGADVNQRDTKALYTALEGVEGSLQVCNDFPQYLKVQEEFMRRGHVKEEDIQRQLAKIAAAHSPEAREQWMAVRVLLVEAGNRASTRPVLPMK